MYSLVLTNENENSLEFNGLNASYNITNISGLSPASADIMMNETAYLDGAMFNNSKVKTRTINIAFTIEEPVETNRLKVYQVIQPKRWIRTEYHSSKLKLYIDGYVESCDIDHFDQKQQATVSIICPFPYFKRKNMASDEMSSVENMFHFPFYNEVNTRNIVFGLITTTEKAIVNNGGIETGLVIEIYANGEVTNPKIFDYRTGEFIGVNTTMEAGDLITINTIRGEKSVTLWRDGVVTNIFNLLMKNSTWLQLPPNGSMYVFTVDSGLESDVKIDISHFDLYEGV